MIKELLEKDNYNALKFLPFIRYIEKLDSFSPIIISDNNNKNSREIVFLQDGYKKCILIQKDNEKEWLTINYKNNKNIENINLLIYDDNYQCVINREENVIIRYDSLIEKNGIAIVEWYSYFYKNDQLKKIIKNIRTVRYDDIKKYTNDNLANLITHIDYDNVYIIEKETEEINNSQQLCYKKCIINSYK